MMGRMVWPDQCLPQSIHAFPQANIVRNLAITRAVVGTVTAEAPGEPCLNRRQVKSAPSQDVKPSGKHEARWNIGCLDHRGGQKGSNNDWRKCDGSL